MAFSTVVLRTVGKAAASLIFGRMLQRPVSLDLRSSCLSCYLSTSSISSSESFSFNTHPQSIKSASHLSTDEITDFEDLIMSNKSIVSVDNPTLQNCLQLVAKSREEFSSLSESLTFLAASTTRVSADLVLSAVWKLRMDWESALLVLRWQEENSLNCPCAWNLVVWACARQGKFDVAWGVVRRMYRRKIVVRQALVVIMESYVSNNHVSKAIKTFHAMEKFNIFADPRIHYVLLRALCKHKNVEEAEELLFHDLKMFPLETEGFNIILDGWCNIIGDVAEAKRIWREMSNRCIYPDVVSYTCMICCISKSGNLFDSLRLYDEMKKRGWIPNLLVYNSLIYVLARENCMDDALSLINKIKDAGLEEDVYTYNSIILPLCEARKMEEAGLLYRKMIEKGITPNIETYHAFAKAESFERSLNLMAEMKNAGFGPNNETFLLIFENLFRLGQSGNALKIWSLMKSYNVVPDASQYNVLVQGLLECGWVQNAWIFFSEMKSKGLLVDPKFEKVFKAWNCSHEYHVVQPGKQVKTCLRRNNFQSGEKIF